MILSADNQWPWFVWLNRCPLCCIIYAFSTRVMHIVYSARKRSEVEDPGTVNPLESVSQFILLGIVIIMCFYQPPFLADIINHSIASLPK
jgi:hypothetical protein